MLAPNLDIQATLGLGRPTNWFYRHRILLIVGAVVLAAAGGAAYWFFGRAAVPSVTYRTAPVARTDLTISVTASGTVQPLNQVDVGTQLSGTVQTVNVDYSDKVEAGEVLATLDTETLAAQASRAQAALDAARASLAQALATLKETSGQLERTRALYARDHQTLQALESAQAAFDRAGAARSAAAAQVDLSQADLTVARNNLAKAEIVSPITGVVLRRDVQPGQTIAASLQAPVLFTLAEDLSAMRVIVDVDEADAPLVKTGDEATFTVEAFETRSFPATVSQLRYAPTTAGGVVTYEAVLSADNKDLSLLPGMTATADITVDRHPDVLAVPNAALRFEPADQAAPSGGLFGMLMPRRQEVGPGAGLKPGEREIWVLRDGSAVPVVVTPGLSDGTQTEILGGELQEGDAVVIDAVPAG